MHMPEPFHIEFSIPPMWETINGIRETISRDERVRNQGETLVNATVMVASELLENAVKYGFHNSDMPAVQFALDIGQDEVKIIVANALSPGANLSRFREILQAIQDSRNPEKLYTDRLLEIANNPIPGDSGLGLYRIAYEGGYNLKFVEQDSILTVYASRKI